MTQENTHISIPQPCPQSWVAMASTAQGAFCHSCQKEVIDFTTMTDRELIRYLEQHTVSCGRLRPDQLDRTVSIPSVQNGTFRWRALLLGLLPFIGARSVMAHPYIKAPTDQALAQYTAKKDTVLAPAPDSLIHISGTVLDENGEGLFGAVVQLRNAKGEFLHIGVCADFDGRFSLDLRQDMVTPDPRTLQISYVGYQPKKIEISYAANQLYHIRMDVKKDENILIQVVTMGRLIRIDQKPPPKRQSWFHRIFLRHKTHHE